MVLSHFNHLELVSTAYEIDSRMTPGIVTPSSKLNGPDPPIHHVEIHCHAKEDKMVREMRMLCAR